MRTVLVFFTTNILTGIETFPLHVLLLLLCAYVVISVCVL